MGFPLKIRLAFHPNYHFHRHSGRRFLKPLSRLDQESLQFSVEADYLMALTKTQRLSKLCISRQASVALHLKTLSLVLHETEAFLVGSSGKIDLEVASKDLLNRDLLGWLIAVHKVALTRGFNFSVVNEVEK